MWHIQAKVCPETWVHAPRTPSCKCWGEDAGGSKAGTTHMYLLVYLQALLQGQPLGRALAVGGGVLGGDKAGSPMELFELRGCDTYTNDEVM